MAGWKEDPRGFEDTELFQDISSETRFREDGRWVVGGEWF